LATTSQDLQGGESDPGSATFDAKIGDSFTLHFGDLVSAKSIPPYGQFNNVGYKTDLSLSISVKTTPDIKMDDVKIDDSGSNTSPGFAVDFDYQTENEPTPFIVGLYFSPTPSFSPSLAVPVTDPSTGAAATQVITPSAPSEPETPGTFH